MYLDYFQLLRKPFSPIPAAGGCILVPGFKRELNRCIEAIEECRCPVMIAGPSGCGKSVMMALIENRFAGEIRTVRLDCASPGNRIELIQSLLGEMGLRFGSESVGELRLKMIDYLKSSENCPNGLLLLIDEAQLLGDEVLEELRLLTNLVCSGRSQVRLVLAGSPELEENVARKESFNQRIAVRSYPRSMSNTETMLFVLAQMQLAGRDGREVFQPSALEKIHSFTGGVARVICQLGDNVLRFAATGKKSLIDAATIELAWYDMQQLPPPVAQTSVNRPGSKSDQESVIEFGSLSDEPVMESSRRPVASSHMPNHAMDDVDQYLQQPIGSSANPIEDYDNDGYFVAETETHADVDATLTTLLRQLDDFEVSGQVVDSSTVFGDDFVQEEEVVDIQSLRISSQNRTSARASFEDVSGIVDSGLSPAWLPVGNEIVFPVDDVVSEPPRDDRDMIIVQESRQIKPEDHPSDTAPHANPANPSPTGNAIRMNYQELFRQLRNNTDVDQ